VSLAAEEINSHGQVIRYVKSKTNRAWKYVAILGVLIIVMLLLIVAYFTNALTENSTTKETISWIVALIKFLLIGGALAFFGVVVNWVYTMRKSEYINKDEILNAVADTEYEYSGTTLNTNPKNVRLEMSMPPYEWMVQFRDEGLVYTFRKGVGIVESWHGETIDRIKAERQRNKIDIKLAEAGIAKNMHSDRMAQMGAIPDDIDEDVE